MISFTSVRTCAFAFAAAAAASFAVPASAATTIDTTGGAFAGDISPFGVTDTSTYGQTFAVGADNFLNSFSLYLSGSPQAAIQFKAYVYNWDGSKATGSALFSSNLQQYAGSAAQEFSFDTTGLQLNNGSRYVAFLSTAGLQAGRPLATATMPFVNSTTYAAGDFVYYNTGNNFAQLTNSDWDCGDNCSGAYGDAYFKASLSSGVAAVPEPATWAMMILGMGAVGYAMRRRIKVSEVNFTNHVRAIAGS